MAPEEAHPSLRPVQGKAWWRQRPHMLALVAIALLGSAGLASTWSGPLRRSSAGKHKHLMSHGVPESLMRANVTAAYADAFCQSFVPSNLTTQHWVDAPMCQRANTTFKVRRKPSLHQLRESPE